MIKIESDNNIAVRHSVLVEFMLKNFKKSDKTYWEDDPQRYVDVDKWQSKSPVHTVRYID